MKISRKNAAFTLIELLVVIAVISILAGLTIPAVQSARRSAQNLSCKNNLRNIGVAVQNFHSSRLRYPATFNVPSGQTVRGSWSIHARILPFMEESNAFNDIDFDIDWHDQVDTGVPAYAVPSYTCPSEIHTETRQQNGQDFVHGTTYGFNMGTWLIHDPVTGQVGDGAFRVNRGTRDRDFSDGTSHTLCASDVRGYTSYIRNVDDIISTLPDSTDVFQAATGDTRLGPLLPSNTGHTVWCDGRVHHTGFTTVFTPNTRVPFLYEGQEYDIDYTTQQEGRDLQRPTYSAITARSYHAAGINTVRMDGSVGFISDTVTLEIWRALGTASGSEVIDSRLLN